MSVWRSTQQPFEPDALRVPCSTLRSYDPVRRSAVLLSAPAASVLSAESLLP
jgi:hypothetical protein